ncbi:restriction endonuclease subunit S [Cutibacterium avidum]|uniref:restriction endonuclease subunit S n=1 Tax=Cutibacterium avidum TaxID=33010 RepID=UPI002FF0409C
MVKEPEDWERKTVGDCSLILQGGTPSTLIGKYWDGDVTWVTPSDISRLTGMWITNSKRNLSPAGIAHSSAVILPEKTILLCTRATIGALALTTRPMATNQGFKNLVCKPGVDPVFLAYLLTTKTDEMKALSVGTTFLELSKKNLSEIPLRVPPHSEQRAIAEVLSGFDEHLANLDELITKKKAIRDGALETLASGRQRLSGFTGYWRDTTLGAIATLNPVTPVPDTFTYVDLESVQGTEMVTSRRVDKIAAPSRAQRLASSGDIFFQTVRPYQRNNYLFKSSAKDVVFSTGYVQIRTQEVPEFLFAAVQQNHFIDQVLERCTGTSYPAISPTALKEVSVRLPKSHSEQRAIAEVLSGMDDEIRLLAEERAKVELLKLGAMDDLLTGRVRLPIEEEAA